MSAHKEDARAQVGVTLKRLREARALSRNDLAVGVGVDLSAVAAWEAGKYLPRPAHRRRVAETLGTTVQALFQGDREPEPQGPKAALVDTLSELPRVLTSLVNRSSELWALRIAAPYPTPAHVQVEFRNILSRRLIAGEIHVERIEIVYSLERLKEIICNIILYDSKPYWTKVFCPGLTDVVPAMGGYMFDRSEFLVGAYWTGVPPHDRPGLHLSGEPFTTYFQSYWREIWSRGELLNIRGSHDFIAAKNLALRLGLREADWPRYLEEARSYEVGDGAPPLI